MSATIMQSIPYFDLKRQYENLREELEAALLETAQSSAYVLSPKVSEFEKTFADYCGMPYGIGVGSGTDALSFSLKALGLGPGDEVIVPSFTFSASIFSIIHAGATPVFAEVDAETYTLDPKSVESCLTKKTKALLPVHLYGQAADMGALMAIAKKRKLKVVEDACQAHGAQWNKQKTGSFGDAGCFSFYPTKNLGATGDGGMVVVKNEKLMEQIKKLRNLGRITHQGPHEIAAWTSRLDALQAAVLSVKIQHLDRFNQNRRRVASRYFAGLQGTPLALPKEGKDCYHVYHLFVVRVPGKKRDALKQHLADEGIGAMIHYPMPTHKQPAIKKYVKKTPRVPITEKLCQEILSLPMFPEMTDGEVDRVCEVIHRFYRTA